MAELEIDQSHLPRVQEVCQCFAVLEDGVLAHNLQEQEIEQYYTTNIQKNQLVQNDIRIAKRLQDEEEEQRAQQSQLLRQASRQLEEQDSEYARVIQEEIQRRSEEARRREQEDEEIAKRIQEEEERRVWRRSESEALSDDSGSVPTSPPPYRRTHSRPRREGQHHSFTASRWQCSAYHTPSEAQRGLSAGENTAPRSSEGHRDSFIRQIRPGFREPGRFSEDSGESDSFPERLPPRSQKRDARSNTAPCRRRASLHDCLRESYSRSVHVRSSFREGGRGRQEERGGRDEDCEYEYDDSEESREGNREWERNPTGEEYEGRCRRREDDRDSRSGLRRDSRSVSVRLEDGDRDRHRPREDRHIARTWTYRENPDRHVRFQEDGRRSNSYHGHNSSRVWEMLGQVLRERGVAVRHSFRGGTPPPRPHSRDSQASHGSEVSYGDSQPHQGAFQRAVPTRRSYHGDVRERRRPSHRENSERDYREGRHDSLAIEEDDRVEEHEEPCRDSVNRERRSSRRWRRGDVRLSSTREEPCDRRIRRSTSEHQHGHREVQEELISEEEQEVERREIRPQRRAPQRSQSLSGGVASSRARSRTAGARLQSQPEGACLDLGELQQVLRDEDLARTLQEEEERLLARSPQPCPSSPHSAYPDGDFRVAQVAQDEEIARFMQKQEIKTKRRSHELEGPASWREHREMISQHGRRASKETPVQRERLDSEGLPSPTDDYSPENQPPSPTSTIQQAQQVRNIAEELDPTFKSRRQGTESLGGEQTVTGPACQSPPVPHSGLLHDFLEEPTFIPPTKRQSDKSGRAKPKEKKENCKQQ